MKSRHWLMAAVIFGVISAATHMRLHELSDNFRMVVAIISNNAVVTSIISAIVELRVGRCEKYPLYQLYLLKKFIIIMLVITVIAFVFIAESLGGSSEDFIAGIFALYVLMFILPSEIAVTIITAVSFFIKKKRCNVSAEEISEDNSDQTKL